MPEAGYAPGRVSPYAKPRCQAVYAGLWAAAYDGLRCDRLEHRDEPHRAVLPPVPGSDEPREVSWL